MRVVNEINTAWAQVENLSAAMPATVDQPCVDASLTRLQSQKIDGYDLFILESMKAHGIEQVITDDSDYATVPGIRVFTANLNVIKSARNQGKLLKR
jgi:predicted nucleic acid-binding protein